MKRKKPTTICPLCKRRVSIIGLEPHFIAKHADQFTNHAELIKKANELREKVEARLHDWVECSLCFKVLRPESIKGHFESFHPGHEAPDSGLKKVDHKRSRSPIVDVNMKMIKVFRH